MKFIVEVLAAGISSIFFAILYNTPKHVLIACGFSGSIGWLVYLSFLSSLHSYPISSFFAALTVNLLAEIFARVLKAPVPLFLIPGIIPFVPGAGMYKTMIALVKNNYDLAINTGFETLTTAGSIAIALMLISSVKIKKNKKKA